MLSPIHLVFTIAHRIHSCRTNSFQAISNMANVTAFRFAAFVAWLAAAVLPRVAADNSDCLSFINKFRAEQGQAALSYNAGSESCVNGQVYICSTFHAIRSIADPIYACEFLTFITLLLQLYRPRPTKPADSTAPSGNAVRMASVSAIAKLRTSRVVSRLILTRYTV